MKKSVKLISRLEGARRLVFESREPILRAGDLGTHVYFLESGTARIYEPWKPRSELTLFLAKPGQILGDEILAGARTYSMSAAPLCPMVLWSVPRAKALRAVRTDAGFAGWVAAQSIDRAQSLARQVQRALTMDVDQRLLAALIELASAFMGRTDGLEAQIPLAVRAISGVAGSTRETVSVRLNRLARQGFVRLGRRMVEVPSVKRLEALLAATRGARLQSP